MGLHSPHQAGAIQDYTATPLLILKSRVNHTVYATREHARIDITRYIELRYGQIRLHSAIGYRTPNEAEHE